MRVLISGGGIAGLTCAYWLRRHGHEPVVVERAPAGPIGGYGIDFSGPGYDIAAQMGLLDELAARRMRVEGFAFVDGSGRVAARLEPALAGKVLRRPFLALMHSTLEEALTGAVADDVEIRYGQYLAAVHQNPTAVEVTFADGTHDTFDMLIGADGVHSLTRELVFGPEERYARHLGFTMACYPISDVDGFERLRAHYNEPGRQAMVYATDRPGESVALFLYRDPDTASVPRAERARRLRTAFAGAGWIVPQLLAAAPDDGVFMDTLTQIEMPSWHHGRTVLIGDACGALTLTSAQGASLAMAGGYLVADALHTHARNPTAAFAAYEAQLRSAVIDRQKRARAYARTTVPATRAGVSAQLLLTRLMLREAFAPLLYRGFGSTVEIPGLPSAGPVGDGTPATDTAPTKHEDRP